MTEHGHSHAVSSAVAAPEAPDPPLPQSSHVDAGSLDLRRIPSLDGLRALSILLVVFGHGSVPLIRNGSVPKWILAILGNGGLGVTVFFVISGFLITSLLLKEFRKTGGISIKDFYLRRAFRIWPAFYVMIGTIAVLGALHVIPVTLGELISSSLFFWNYYPAGKTEFLGHTWSLAVEEQFYLIWPLVLGWAGLRRSTWIAVALIAGEPLIRVGTYFLMPSMQGHIPIMVHTRADALMIGALAALLYRDQRFQRVLKQLYAWHLPLVGGLFALCVDIFLIDKWGGTYSLPFGYTLQNFGIVMVMLWAIQNPGKPFGRLLNTPWAIHIGHISYSLYLWHLLFLSLENKTITGTFPLNLILTFAVAECSYWFVEQPFLRLRGRVMGAH